ncbi:MAG: universal stress protein [Candidatus Rokuibacteriota bacterium]
MKRARGSRGFPVLVASDGSAPARQAVTAAVAFPWPPGSRGHGIVASHRLFGGRPTAAGVAARAAALERIAGDTQKALRRRWRDARVVTVERPPATAILAEARRRGAGAIVAGSAGHGALGRLLVGSVTRALARGASCPVLVVRGRARAFRHIVLGFDGSANARRAADFVARLTVPRGGRAIVIQAVPPEPVVDRGVGPAAARAIARERAAVLDREALRAARADTEETARVLAEAGWKVQVDVRLGAPLDTLLRAARKADLLVVGARGKTGLRGLLLGSVADGALNRAPTSVLVV